MLVNIIDTPSPARTTWIPSGVPLGIKEALAGSREGLARPIRMLGHPLNLGHAYAVIADRSPEGAKFERIAYVDANHDRAQTQACVAHCAEPVSSAPAWRCSRGFSLLEPSSGNSR
jgi:hypothetical protein